ncbi:hypothetical protein ACFXTH_018893 [Malus domestica]
MQSKEEEGEKGIFETFPKNQEQEVNGKCLEFIKEDTLETKIPKEVGFYDTGKGELRNQRGQFMKDDLVKTCSFE